MLGCVQVMWCGCTAKCQMKCSPSSPLVFSCVYLYMSAVSQFIFVFLSICLPHCLPPLNCLFRQPLSLSQFHCLYLCLSPSVDLCLTIPTGICNAKSKQTMVSWLWQMYRTIKDKKGFFSTEIFPSAKPRNNTGSLLLNYSTVLNLILIPSHALNIALMTMYPCILSYIIAFSALWFSTIIPRLRSDQGLVWCTLILRNRTYVKSFLI